jgi:hypothetical protein
MGYVEPNPHLYGRLASLASFMRDGLDERGLLIGEVRTKLDDLVSLLLSLKTISEKELVDDEISYEEYDLIASIGDRLEDLVTFSEEVSGQIESETDDEMAVVADVHTDPNTEQVLEEGVGYPMNLYVIVNIEGRLVISQGGMFSYFEFGHPMADRLTDEAWQQMLKSASAPELPIWMASYVADVADTRVLSPWHSVAEVSPVSMLELQVAPRVVRAGETVTIYASLPYGRGQAHTDELTISLKRPGGEVVSVPLQPCYECERPDTYVGTVDSERWEPGEGVVEALWQTGYQTYETRRSLLVDSGSAVEEQQAFAPRELRLEQNVPNPFNPSTTMRFTLPENARHVTLAVYNLRGQRVRTLADGPMEAGTHVAFWDGRDALEQDAASGVYFCRLSTNDGGYAQTTRMVLIR